MSKKLYSRGSELRSSGRIGGNQRKHILDCGNVSRKELRREMIGSDFDFSSLAAVWRTGGRGWQE